MIYIYKISIYIYIYIYIYICIYVYILYLWAIYIQSIYPIEIEDETIKQMSNRRVKEKLLNLL